MNKLFFSLAILLVTGLSTLAQTPSKTAPVKAAPETIALPDCVMIKDGKLIAKAGYTVTVSNDGKMFTVSKDNNVNGTFSCECTGRAGECDAKSEPAGLVCKGKNCGECSMVVVIKGITYRVDIAAGILRKN